MRQCHVKLWLSANCMVVGTIVLIPRLKVVFFLGRFPQTRQRNTSRHPCAPFVSSNTAKAAFETLLFHKQKNVDTKRPLLYFASNIFSMCVKEKHIAKVGIPIILHSLSVQGYKEPYEAGQLLQTSC